MHWHCHRLFNRMPQSAVAGGIAVVIDVLRASTTMATALAEGASAVLPVRDVAEARGRAAALGPPAITGGERGGRRIDGFDLGNSPREYGRDRVAGRTVVFTTTNGTAAIDACRDAREVIVGAIVNRTAAAAAARRLALAAGVADVHLVCAGTDGLETREDLLGAGAILDAAGIGADDDLDADARAALADFRGVVAARQAGGDAAPGGAPAALVRAFRTAAGGRNLVALGMDADLVAAALIDGIVTVPRLDRASGLLLADDAHGG